MSRIGATLSTWASVQRARPQARTTLRWERTRARWVSDLSSRACVTTGTTRRGWWSRDRTGTCGATSGTGHDPSEPKLRQSQTEPILHMRKHTPNRKGRPTQKGQGMGTGIERSRQYGPHPEFDLWFDAELERRVLSETCQSSVRMEEIAPLLPRLTAGNRESKTPSDTH